MSSSSQSASFPPEILGEIFLASIPVLGNRENRPAYLPWTLSHVCRYWRTSALSFPKLWSFLDVEQTQENEEGGSPAHFLMETYLERSGKHPLTFRLAYSNETMHYQSFLECLNNHCARWRDVVIDSPDHRALEVLFQADPSDYPNLRSLVCSSCDFNHEAERSLGPIPWSQLQRYHEYECMWSPDSEHQWSIITQLTNVVDLRVEFYGDCAAFYSSDDDSDGEDDETKNDGDSNKDDVVELNRLQFASFAVHQRAEDLDITQILDCLHLPAVQGLNLKFMPNHSPDLLFPMPAQLKGLKILRLCGSLVISNEALSCILTELEGLADLAVEMRGVGANVWGDPGLDAMHLFTLLTPSRNTESVVLLPKLQALRITEFELVDGVVDTLLAMLRQRFAVDGADFARLKRFEFSSLKAQKRPSTLLDTLELMQVQEGWNIRIDEERQDFWRVDMTSEFL
ncbi:hypothetical protein C8F04DRAFT_1398445 [Mycena alexandri]|uniref:F-box domain-containing protein n=1 Tax=Mycena alexandri TaxID=1745969 RepID=A0AAD6SJV7_9AGAR|nr:hypothetical protein C8F04DRAFT_1398445 [Mycena alexandri]